MVMGKKKTVGIILIIIGLVALLTPFTPGSWLIFIGLELLGFRILFAKKFKKGGADVRIDKEN
jgi:uncharacterized protein YqgC (DUF456 family)